MAGAGFAVAEAARILDMSRSVLDGMVAVETGISSAIGELYNEITMRFLIVSRMPLSWPAPGLRLEAARILDMSRSVWPCSWPTFVRQ